MTILRRYLTLCALLFWQGGFTYYSLVVVPIIRRVLGDHEQLPLAAQITGPVTNWLNAVGVAAVVLLLWDLTATADASRSRRHLRGGAWAVMVVTLVALFVLHYLLDRLGPLYELAAADRPTFWAMHSAYLAASTLQWVGGLTYLGAAVCAWRAQDMGRTGG